MHYLYMVDAVTKLIKVHDEKKTLKQLLIREMRIPIKHKSNQL